MNANLTKNLCVFLARISESRQILKSERLENGLMYRYSADNVEICLSLFMMK